MKYLFFIRYVPAMQAMAVKVKFTNKIAMKIFADFNFLQNFFVLLFVAAPLHY